ncbi:MAG: hypothetical protein ACRCSX_11100 [Allorhizobium sp.]
MMTPGSTWTGIGGGGSGPAGISRAGVSGTALLVELLSVVRPFGRFGGGGGTAISMACFLRLTWSDLWIRVPTFGGRGCDGTAGAEAVFRAGDAAAALHPSIPGRPTAR